MLDDIIFASRMWQIPCLRKLDQSLFAKFTDQGSGEGSDSDRIGTFLCTLRYPTSPIFLIFNGQILINLLFEELMFILILTQSD